MSDSDQGDLDLEALKSIFGSQAFDDAPPAKEKPKKTSSKKSNKSSSKKTQKQKKPAINLDDLLDGVDFNPAPNDDIDNEGFDFLNPQKNASYKQDMQNFGNNIYDFQTNVDVFANFEKKIEKYLDSSIRTMQNDVIKEIEQILIETDNFDDITINFLEKLNHSIYEIITYEKSSVSGNQSAFYSIFEEFSNSFLDSFRKIGEFSSRSTAQNINIIRSCKNLVEAKNPIFERQMTNAAHDIKQEIGELNKARSPDSSLKNENTKKSRNYFHQHVLLEGKIKALDEMNETIMKRIEKFQESKNQLFSNTNKKFLDDDIVLNHLKKASRYLKNIYLKKKINESKLIKTKLDNFFFACENLLTTINQTEFTLNLIANSFSDSQTNQSNYSPLPLSQMNMKPKVVEESKNSLIEYKNKRENQFQEINDTIQNFNKRVKTQVDE